MHFEIGYANVCRRYSNGFFSVSIWFEENHNYHSTMLLEIIVRTEEEQFHLKSSITPNNMTAVHSELELNQLNDQVIAQELQQEVASFTLNSTVSSSDEILAKLLQEQEFALNDHLDDRNQTKAPYHYNVPYLSNNLLMTIIIVPI
jgi:hypothetical protein